MGCHGEEPGRIDAGILTQGFTIRPQPRPTSVAPSFGSDGGPVTLVISGTGFEATANASLTRTGQTPIPGTQRTVSPDGLTLTATFDLLNRALGF